MLICENCKCFFSIPENEDDYEVGKGDCVREVVDEKGKYWLSKVVDRKDYCDCSDSLKK
jgi:hypothetical protein